MSEELCRQIDLETFDDASQRCERFDAACPGCLCERFSFGNGSPGTVGSQEVLARFHFSPHDLDDDGKPTTLAFCDVASVGLSVTRDGASDGEMERAIADRLATLAAAGRAQTWHSVSLVTASDVRGFHRTQEGQPPERCFCVYDTAQRGNRMHAEICQTRAGRKFRKHLRDKFRHETRQGYRRGRLEPEACGLPQTGESSST